MVSCLALAGAILLRAAFIQLFGNSRLEAMARRQFQTHSLIRPQRGAILDRNGDRLAVNLETNSLAANPSKIQNRKSVARILSRATEIPYEKVLQKLKESR